MGRNAGDGANLPVIRVQGAMNTVWRFYRDKRNQWHWQELTVTHTVVRESDKSYASYDVCIAAAKKSGYEFQAAHEKRRQR